jgi:hypothetical protein
MQPQILVMCFYKFYVDHIFNPGLKRFAEYVTENLVYAPLKFDYT